MCLWTSGNCRKNCLLVGAEGGQGSLLGSLASSRRFQSNSNYNRAMMGRFKKFINDQALKEIPLHGRHFTWLNQHAAPTLVKLDRVLCTVDWEDNFRTASRAWPLMTLTIAPYSLASSIIILALIASILRPFGQRCKISKKRWHWAGIRSLQVHALLLR
jgi:hypothetical protein